MINTRGCTYPIREISRGPAVSYVHLNQAKDQKLDSTIMERMLGSETASHCFNTAEIVYNFTKYLNKNVAEKMKENPLLGQRKTPLFNDEEMDSIKIAAFLHDIGKAKIPDEILYKSKKLSEEEFGVMETHTSLGKSILDSWLGKDNICSSVAKYHHEKADGSGYYGKKAGLIDQIVGLADVWEALTAKRSYKKALPNDTALSILRQDTQKGKFNKGLFKMFEDFLSEQAQISKKPSTQSLPVRKSIENKSLNISNA